MLNSRALRIGIGGSLGRIQHAASPPLKTASIVACCRYSLNANHQRNNKATPPPPSPPRKFPELLYFPKFFRWLGMKFKLKYLQKAWDPEFSEGAFIYGSTQAICRITEIIHANEPHQLGRLLTERAATQLRDDVQHKLSALQKKVIRLAPPDIKLLVPVKVQLVKDEAKDARRCFVLLKSLSMKWYQENQSVKLVLIVIDTEFTREYGGHGAAGASGGKSEWFISLFNIVQCALIGGNTATGV